MATLVTGGTGFVGSNIVRALAKAGHTVVSMDLVAPDDLVKGYLEPWKSQVTFVQGNILRQEDLDRAAAPGVDKIIHAAVFTGILPEIEKGQSRSIVEVNLIGTTNLLELARQVSVDRFVYVSSGSVYGDGPGLPDVLQETTAPNPQSLYAIGKYASELLAQRYGHLHGFQAASVRVGTPYGPMERVTGHRANQSLLKKWTGNIARNEPIEVSDRTVKRSFTHVSDIAEGIRAVLDAPALSYGVYNNSSAERTSIAEIVATLQDLSPGLLTTDVTEAEIPGRASGMDVARLEQDTGFVAKLDLKSGLRDYLAWRKATGFTE